MDKPITVARMEFAEAVVEAARESRLPAFILADVLRDLREQLQQEAAAQYQADRKAWEEAQPAEEDGHAGDDQ